MREIGLIVFALASLSLAGGCADDPPPGPVPPPDEPRGRVDEIAEPPALPETTLVGGDELPEGGAEGAGAGAAGEPEAAEARAVPEPLGWEALDEDLRDNPSPLDARTRKDVEASRVFVEFKSTRLGDAARFIEEQTGIRVRVHPTTWEECTQEDVAVTLESGTRSVAETLDLFRGRGRIYWWIEDGGVLLAPRPPKPVFVETKIPLGRLTDTESGPRWRYLDEDRVGFEGDAICDIVRSRIDLAVWDEGGDIRFGYEENVLLVKAPRATQRRIMAQLRKLAKGEL